MENETVYRGPEVEESSKGSVILGIVGALVGAVIGAIPWFLASTFTNFFIGYLGFLIGWAAAFGYGKLHGRRSFPLAMVTVVVCSIIALVLADFASNMYVLCTDAEWQHDAWLMGMSVAELAYLSITAPENLSVILPNLLIGMLIGLLGVASSSGYVRNYTQSGKVGRPAAAPNAAPYMAGGVNGWVQPASTGLELPRQFTVRAPKRNMVMGIVLAALFGVLMVFSVFMGIMADMGAGSLLFVLIYVWLLILAVILILQGKNWRLEVDGDRLCAYTAFGRATEFHASDIASVSMPSMLNGQARLYGQDGKVLFKFTAIMQNQPLLMQYLAEHNIPLRG